MDGRTRIDSYLLWGFVTWLFRRACPTFSRGLQVLFAFVCMQCQQLLLYTSWGSYLLSVRVVNPRVVRFLNSRHLRPLTLVSHLSPLADYDPTGWHIDVSPIPVKKALLHFPSDALKSFNRHSAIHSILQEPIFKPIFNLSRGLKAFAHSMYVMPS
jgi:hypothetical protein